METELLYLSFTLENIQPAVKRFWETLHDYTVFAFSGDMGAGKTTIIHKLCDYLQVQDVVSSPTFALINEYHFTDSTGQGRTIYHMDWYRLKDSAEAINTGMEDCIVQAQQGKAYCFIEWPEKARELLPHPCIWIHIEAKTHTERVITAMLNG